MHEAGRLGIVPLCLLLMALPGPALQGCKSSPPKTEIPASGEEHPREVRWEALFQGDPVSEKAYGEIRKDLRSRHYAAAVGKLKNLTKHSKGEPWDEVAQFQLAQALMLKGEYSDALSQLDLFLRRYSDSPDVPDALLTRGKIYDQMSREGGVHWALDLKSRIYFDKAVRIFRDVQRKFPNREDVQAKSWYYLGSCYDARKDLPKARQAYQKIVDDHTKSAFGAKALYALGGLSLRKGEVDRAERIFGELTDQYPEAHEARKARANLQTIGLVGYKAPELQVTKWIGNLPEVVWESMGTPVLVSFWAIWCTECRRNIHDMNRRARKYAPKGLQVVGITQERPGNGIDRIREYIEKHPMLFPTGVDDRGKTSRAYLVSNVPRVVLIDSAGKIAWYGHPSYLTDRVIENLLQGSS